MWSRGGIERRVQQKAASFRNEWKIGNLCCLSGGIFSKVLFHFSYVKMGSKTIRSISPLGGASPEGIHQQSRCNLQKLKAAQGKWVIGNSIPLINAHASCRRSLKIPTILRMHGKQREGLECMQVYNILAGVRVFLRTIRPYALFKIL